MSRPGSRIPNPEAHHMHMHLRTLGRSDEPFWGGGASVGGFFFGEAFEVNKSLCLVRRRLAALVISNADRRHLIN